MKNWSKKSIFVQDAKIDFQQSNSKQKRIKM